MDATATRELYRRWLPGMWNAAPEEMDSLARRLFAPGAVAHWDQGRDHVGPEEIAEQVRTAVTMFRDVRVALLTEPIVDGAWVVGRWEFAANYPGGVPGFDAPPGTSVRYRGVDVMRVDGDRFVEYWPHGDNLELMRQLRALG
ncbi:SnoaL-like polyketide cyclase [Haloactinospora alba]|uniref:SnoaL-like polyketide cyclase n=1 Tax=Haloactinospora alba TaxID=405555 RepID=A0A543NA51_9ACTN|nr:ester cyclase [Haloactinospora alba]TQN28717.1 SnoaL-like polyketide cyclase [Haloactinospora alba]